MKAAVYIATSLEGFIARKNGDLDWLPGADGQTENNNETEQAEDYGYQAFMDSVERIVMGRNTFEMVHSFGAWPYEKPVTVLSRSMKELPEGIPETVDLQDCSPAQLVEDLKQKSCKSIYVDGGKTIQGFLAAGLITEITVTRVPILLGEGIPLFGPLSGDVRLEHLDTKSFPNGFVQSRYKTIF